MKALKFAVAAAAALLASAANAEWHEARTNHFIVYSEGKQAEVAAFAERLERFDNAMRVVQRMPTNEVIPDIAKVHVFRFGDTSDIGALAGSRGVAGFYIPHAARPVAFTPAREFKDRRSLERTLEDPTFSAEVVLFHEYTHHFMLKNFATTYPGWYIEGFAEANATIMLRPDGSFVYGMPANHRARELTELPQLHVRKLLDPAYEFRSGTEAIQKYSLGWLLTHYLAFSKDRAGQMQTYLSLLGKGTPGMAAAEQAFGDLDSLNRELSKYKGTNLPAREVILANFVKPVVTTRLLAPNEEQIMRHRIRLSRGVSRSEARGIASTLWGQAAARPQDLALQVLAAEAHLDASKHAEAITLADRALAINPNSVDALVYKARALFEAKQGTDDRFAKARDLLIKARDIDAKDPRPLIELYRSYRASPVRPIPESALIALDNAYDLALHDRTFRVLLARQLMEEGRARPAEQVLAPLAYGYDGNDPEDNFAANAMKKMKAGDMAGALAILNKQLKGVDGLDEDD